MENAEEVMQLLEEFSKIKPKEIPRELEDYLGYVAKTGDPVYQWSLVKNLFREKLLSVITDFYESTLTVELPPCPNVDPFNYERMKTSLLERFDTFSSAPFTVQRICELLTNPRKEYNRADKYMRAIEKNILVVSTREPGSGKRPLECDSQSETVLNGIPDVKLSDSDGGFLHVPTDLPYLGAPPASNDVTVETTEPNSTINDRVGLEINGEAKPFKSECDKPWPVHESPVVAQDTEQASVGSDTQEEDVSLHIEEKCPEENNSCDTNDSQANVDDISANISPEHFEGESSSDVFTENNETVLPDTGSIDSSQECDTEIPPNINLENEESGSACDENEVSSTPADATVDIPLILEETDEPTDSEAEATDSSLKQHTESVLDTLPDSEVNSSDRVIETSDTKSITISDVTATKSDEVDLECNEITGTVDSPLSPGNSPSLQADDLIDQNINLSELDECDQPDSHPDSSNDVCSQSKATTVLESQPRPELCTEADSMSESNIGLELGVSEVEQKSDLEDSPDQTNNEIHIDNSSHVLSPVDSNVGLSEEEHLQKTLDESVLSSSSPKETVDEVSEGPSSNSVIEDTIKLDEIQSTSEVTDEMCDQERREGSVIQSVANIPPDCQQQMSTIEEISVDPSCEVEEEAMDVDDTSNQMMISEGENEVEPMDQSDQLQS